MGMLPENLIENNTILKEQMEKKNAKDHSFARDQTSQIEQGKKIATTTQLDNINNSALRRADR